MQNDFNVPSPTKAAETEVEVPVVSYQRWQANENLTSTIYRPMRGCIAESPHLYS